ncbi:UNVERIFIED_CONTAM: hypothetical protein K2H54_040052 [Gekko kuhli]
MQTENVPDWVGTAEEYSKPYHLREVIWNIPSSIWDEFLLSSFKQWDKLKVKLAPDTSPIMPFMAQAWFPPAEHPNAFPEWRINNMVRLMNVYKDKKPLDKQELETKIEGHLPWFEYLQLQHFLQHVCRGLNRNLTEFEQIASNLISKGILSKIHSNLISTLSASPPKYV